MKSLFIIVLAAFLSSATNTYAQDYKVDFLNDSIRILYTGYDNLIIIPEGASLSVIDAPKSCVFAKINTVTYSAKAGGASAGKEIKLGIQHKGKSVTRIFKVKNLPQPSVYIGGIDLETTRTATKDKFLSSATNGVRISYPSDEMIKVKFQITRYHLKVKIAGIAILDETVDGANFSNKAMKLFKDKAQYTIEISEIFGQSPSGAVRTTNPLPMEVK
jgi:GldM C-terminal domain